MEGRIFGIPLVLIVLVVTMLAPLLAADYLLSREVKALEAKKPVVTCVTAVPTPIMPTLTPTPTVPVRAILHQATSSAR